jgi:hypothetical protein
MAAFLQYFFSDPRGPEPVWMQAVLAVERQEIGINDVASWVLAQRSATAAIDCHNLMAMGVTDDPTYKSPDPKPGTDQARLREARRSMGRCSRAGNEWHNVRRLGRGDAVAGLIQFWNLLSRNFSPDHVLHSVDLETLAVDAPQGDEAKPGDESILRDPDLIAQQDLARKRAEENR